MKPHRRSGKTRGISLMMRPRHEVTVGARNMAKAARRGRAVGIAVDGVAVGDVYRDGQVQIACRLVDGVEVRVGHVPVPLQGAACTRPPRPSSLACFICAAASSSASTGSTQDQRSRPSLCR